MTKLDVNNKYINPDKIGVETGTTVDGKKKGTSLAKYLKKRNPIYNLAFQQNMTVGTSETSLLLENGEFDVFTVKNGVIEIGKDINLIRICATISIQNTTATGGQRRLNLKKNSDIIKVVYANSISSIYYNATFTLNTVIEVKEGDKLSLSAGSSSGNCIVLTGTYENIYIEKLK